MLKQKVNYGVFNGKVSELYSLIEKEYKQIKQWTLQGDSNANKKRKALEYCEKLLLNIPQNIVFKGLGYNRNGGVNQRFIRTDFNMVELGDIAELCLAWLLYPANKKPLELSKSQAVEDIRKGIIAYDCKASFSGTSQNTAFTEDEITINNKNQGLCVLLINQVGIFRIGKSERDEIRATSNNAKEKQMIFLWNKEYNNHYTSLEDMIGWCE